MDADLAISLSHRRRPPAGGPRRRAGVHVRPSQSRNLDPRGRSAIPLADRTVAKYRTAVHRSERVAEDPTRRTSTESQAGGLAASWHMRLAGAHGIALGLRQPREYAAGAGIRSPARNRNPAGRGRGAVAPDPPVDDRESHAGGPGFG